VTGSDWASWFYDPKPLKQPRGMASYGRFGRLTAQESLERNLENERLRAIGELPRIPRSDEHAPLVVYRQRGALFGCCGAYGCTILGAGQRSRDLALAVAQEHSDDAGLGAWGGVLMPSRASVMANHRKHEEAQGRAKRESLAARVASAGAGLLLTDLGFDKTQVLAIPFAALADATADDAPFDVSEFWTEDDFRQWHPEPRQATAAWLATEPTLSERCSRPDPGWGVDYSPAPLIAPPDRDSFEHDAAALGYQILRAEGLELLHVAGPDVDVQASLLALVGGS